MARFGFRLPYVHKLFLSHLVAVLLVSGSVGTFFYDRAMDNLLRSLRSRLQNSAALLSHTIEGKAMEAIRGPESVELEVYRKTLDQLRGIRRLNPDIAFLYVMRLEGGRVEFVVDSDETTAQAPPGRVYPDVPPSMLKGFHAPSVDEELFRDEWGVFLSGYAPLRGGDGRYLVGIDMRAGEVDQKLSELRLTGIVSLLASVLLALGFGFLLSRGLVRRIHAVTGRCRRIASGRYDEPIAMRTYDEFEDLTQAFNSMAENLEKARARADAALEEVTAARDGLESRVKARTRELQRALDQVKVLKGMLPICASCKKIRNDRGYWQQIETFVEQHTDAQFSHGLCPPCAVKLYGDVLSAETSEGGE